MCFFYIREHQKPQRKCTFMNSASARTLGQLSSHMIPTSPLQLGDLHMKGSTFSVYTKHIYMKSTTVYVPSSELGPPPLSPASVPLLPEPKGGGAHSPAGEGLGESQFRRLEKSLALCLPCDCTSLMLGWQNMYRRGGEASGPAWSWQLKVDPI